MIDTHTLPEAYRVSDAHARWLRVNFVSSADGAVTIDGRSGGLGNESDRALMKVLREMADVVLVGAGTVRAEGYGGINLPEEAQARRVEAGKPAEPRIAVVSNRLDLEVDRSVFVKPSQRTLVITCEASDPAKREELARVADVWVCGADEVDIGLAVERLTQEGATRVLCEGGPHLFGSLLTEGLVDEVCLTLAPLFVAGDTSRISVSHEAAVTRMRLAHALPDRDGTLLLRYVRDEATQ